MRTFYAAMLVTIILVFTGSTLVDIARAGGPLSLSGTTGGTFTDPQPTDTTYTGVGTDFFTYGESLGTPNQLTIDGTSIDTLTGSDFAVGRLTYFNGGTFIGSTADSVQLDLTLTFSTPVSTTIPLPVTLDLLTTENTTGAADPDADYVTAAFTSSPFFTVGGTSYEFRLLGFNNLSGAGTLFDPYTLRLGEQDSTSADLVGVVAPVPEPSSFLLLLSAALSFYCLLRHRFV
jgi:hypothetical protein